MVVVAGETALLFFGRFATVDVGGGSVLPIVGLVVGVVVGAIVGTVVDAVIDGTAVVVLTVVGRRAGDIACGRSFVEAAWPHANAPRHTADTSAPNLRRGTVTTTYRQIAGRG